mmetsp:Transcript_59047/g.137484  ORF Transcript_59047/g.137484 Transcript_59047/m.137484 type:complete len:234 (+) Transcript_59047:535-1236(+)
MPHVVGRNLDTVVLQQNLVGFQELLARQLAVYRARLQRQEPVHHRYVLETAGPPQLLQSVQLRVVLMFGLVRVLRVGWASQRDRPQRATAAGTMHGHCLRRRLWLHSDRGGWQLRHSWGCLRHCADNGLGQRAGGLRATNNCCGHGRWDRRPRRGCRLGDYSPCTGGVNHRCRCLCGSSCTRSNCADDPRCWRRRARRGGLVGDCGLNNTCCRLALLADKRRPGGASDHRHAE